MPSILFQVFRQVFFVKTKKSPIAVSAILITMGGSELVVMFVLYCIFSFTCLCVVYCKRILLYPQRIVQIQRQKLVQESQTTL